MRRTKVPSGCATGQDVAWLTPTAAGLPEAFHRHVMAVRSKDRIGRDRSNRRASAAEADAADENSGWIGHRRERGRRRGVARAHCGWACPKPSTAMLWLSAPGTGSGVTFARESPRCDSARHRMRAYQTRLWQDRSSRAEPEAAARAVRGGQVGRSFLPDCPAGPKASRHRSAKARRRSGSLALLGFMPCRGSEGGRRPAEAKGGDPAASQSVPRLIPPRRCGRRASG